jgi:hypothetical protein
MKPTLYLLCLLVVGCQQSTAKVVTDGWCVYEGDHKIFTTALDKASIKYSQPNDLGCYAIDKKHTEQVNDIQLEIFKVPEK